MHLKYSKKLIYLLFILLLGGFQAGIEFRHLHSAAVVIDAHNDVVQRILKGEDISRSTNHGHSDLPRFRESGIDVQIFSIWVPPQSTNHSYYDQANWQIDSLQNFVRRNPAEAEFAGSSSDIGKNVKNGKFTVMLGLEGGHPIENDLRKLEHFYNRGVRYLTLTWNNSTNWATSASDEEAGNGKIHKKGLSAFGIKVVNKMNKLGMIIDVSHLGEKSFWDVIKATRKPVIASHSCAWSLCPNRRNLKDDQIEAIAKSGGVVFLNFAPFFIDSTFARKEKAILARNKTLIDSITNLKTENTEELIHNALSGEYLKIRPSLSQLVDHIDYMVKLAGADHVGLGSDFDGISVTPKDLDDVTYYPNITKELVHRGYTEIEIRKILGENFIRVLNENEN